MHEVGWGWMDVAMGGGNKERRVSRPPEFVFAVDRDCAWK